MIVSMFDMRFTTIIPKMSFLHMSQISESILLRAYYFVVSMAKKMA
jgi:hypothetical protein